MHLSQEDLDAAVAISDGGAIEVGRDAVARLVAGALDTDATPLIAVSSADYAETSDRTPVPETRSATGLWWVTDEHDEAEVGTWTIDGLAMTVLEEGLRNAPVSTDESLVGRATAAVAAGYPDGEVVSLGLARGTVDGTKTDIRVFAVRDHRVTRVEDLLDTQELDRHRRGELGVAWLMDVGGGKALVRKVGC